MGVIMILAVVLATAQAGLADEGLVIEQLTDGDINNAGIAISGAHAVWQGKEPNDWEIFYYDGNTVTQITENDTDDIRPQIQGSSIVWQGRDTNEGDWEIFYYNGQGVVQITDNNNDDVNPRISAARIFWKGWDGQNWQVFSAAFPVSITMKVSPATINLKSNGQSITVALSLGTALKAGNVDISSLRLLGQVAASSAVVVSGSNKLIIKFDRSEVQSLLQAGSNVEITLTGKMKDGTVITATDTVKVINPGKAK
jgi:hypothetical protein